MAARTDAPARRRIDRYELEEELGRGGMGVVYAARDTHIDRRIALKVLTPALADDEVFVARFEQEMRVAASLEHPHVVPVHEIGRRDGSLFIAMRLVEGEDLRRVVAREGALDPLRVGRVVRQIGGALDAAHARGMVHRDVKPANILLSGEGEDEHAYLLDFGLAREAAEHAQLTAPGEWIGTLDYAAPEQIAGVPLRPAADVYALGCVAFCALTGAPPFGGSTPQKIKAHTHDPLPTAGGALAATVDPVLARATHKDPARRHASAAEFGRELDAAIRAAGAVPAAAVAAAAEQPTRVGTVTPGTRRRSLWPLRTAAAVLALVLAALAVVALHGSDGGRTGSATASTDAPKTATTARKKAPTAPPTAAWTAPAGGWTARVPDGDGWHNDGETDVNGVLRTIFRGPDGAQVWVDATPRVAPVFGTEGRTDIRTERYTTPVGGVVAYRFRGQPDFCARGCIDDQLDLGGHGFAVLGGPTRQARMAARHLMRTLRPVAAAQPAATQATTTSQAPAPAPAAKGKGEGKGEGKAKGKDKKGRKKTAVAPGDAAAAGGASYVTGG